MLAVSAVFDHCPDLLVVVMNGPVGPVTDEELDAIKAGAAQAGMKMSPWFVQCALTVEPWPQNHRRLILDAREQRYISRVAGEFARSLHSNSDGSSRFANDLRQLFETRLRTMVREDRGYDVVTLLRTVFGHERAETIAAALVPEVRATPASPAKPGEKETEIDVPDVRATLASPERPDEREAEIEERPDRDQGELAF